MSCNHPPIPPKSERFELCERVNAPNTVLFHAGALSNYLHHPERIALFKDIIAAVAEVEWTKRAEKWRALYSRFSRRYLYRTPQNSRTIWFKRAARKCEENADAWREWGASRS